MGKAVTEVDGLADLAVTEGRTAGGWKAKL